MSAENKRPAEDCGSEDAAKRAKVENNGTVAAAVTDLNATVKKQVEYYLSDVNLKNDKFFFDKISGDKEGWLPMEAVLACNKIKQLNISAEKIAEALQGSEHAELNSEKTAVRRKDNKPLPKFEGRTFGKKQAKDPATITCASEFQHQMHSAGVVLRFANVAEDVQFLDIKTGVKNLVMSSNLPGRVFVNFCSSKKQEGEKTGANGAAEEGEKIVESVYISVSAFEQDIAFFKEKKTVKVVSNRETDDEKTHDLDFEVIVNPATLDKIIASMPQDIREKRKKHKRMTATATKNKVLKIGTFGFPNIVELKRRVREIQTARSDGEELKKGGSDYKLIEELLSWHPKAASKKENMKGLKVDVSTFGGNRCFFVLKEDGSTEDFSMVKILQAIEANPPFEGKNAPQKKAEQPAAEKKSDEPAADKEEKKAETTPTTDASVDQK